MIALLITIFILLFLYQSNLLRRAVTNYWNVRDSKDGVKRHFHREQMIVSINIFVFSLVFMVCLIYANL